MDFGSICHMAIYPKPYGYSLGQSPQNSAKTNFAETREGEVRRSLIRRSSANRPSGKFALMEFSEIRLRQDRYFRLYEP
jgi:hypothetical protein